MRGFLFLAAAGFALFGLSTPANALEGSGSPGVGVEVEGNLDSTGYWFAGQIALNEEDARMGGNVAPPPTYRWVHSVWPGTSVVIDPVNNVTYCPEGQEHIYAWRELNALGSTVWGLPVGTTIPFWLTQFGTGTRIAGTENIPIAGGLDSTDVWYVHVCVGPSTPSVEGALDGLIPEPLVGLNPEPGFGGITGFETWGWYEQEAGFGSAPELVVDDLIVRDPRWGIPYTVDARLWAYRYEWDFGDGTPPLVVTRPGGEGNLPFSASATHTYETKGTWPVTLTVTWTGEYTYTGYTGIEVLTPSDRIAIADYPVQEVVTRTVVNP